MSYTPEFKTAVRDLRAAGWEVTKAEEGEAHPFLLRDKHWEKPLGATEYGVEFCARSVAQQQTKEGR